MALVNLVSTNGSHTLLILPDQFYEFLDGVQAAFVSSIAPVVQEILCVHWLSNSQNWSNSS